MLDTALDDSYRLCAPLVKVLKMQEFPFVSQVRQVIVLSVLVGIALLGCSGIDDEPEGASSDASTQAAQPSTEPASTSLANSPSPTPAATPAVTVGALMEIGEQVFPRHSSGVYAVCGVSGNLDVCPYTGRLKDRLTEVSATLCRCQNPSMTRAMSAEVTDFGGVLHVTLYDGSQSYMLTILNEDGELLVDDQICQGGGPDTSIYNSIGPCH